MKGNASLFLMMGLLAVVLGAGSYFLFLHKKRPTPVPHPAVRDGTRISPTEREPVPDEKRTVKAPDPKPVVERTPEKPATPLPPAPVPSAPVPAPEVKPSGEKKSFNPLMFLKDDKEKALFEKFAARDISGLLNDHLLDIQKRQAWREADILRLAIVARGEEAVPAMIDLVANNPHFYFNEAGIRVLAEMKQYGLIEDSALADRAVAAIISAFKMETQTATDGKYATQWWAIHGLTTFGGEKVREALPFGLNSISDRVRLSTLGAILQVWRSSGMDVEAMKDDKIFQANLEGLKEALARDRSSQVQASAAAVIQRLMKDRAFPILSEIFYGQPQLGVQQAVVTALRDNAQEETRTFLNRAYQNTLYPEVKRSILLSLTSSQDPESFKTIRMGVYDSRPFVAETALQALKNQGSRLQDDSKLLYDVIDLLGSKQPASVRFAAADLLSSIRVKDATQSEMKSKALSVHGLKGVEDLLMEKTELPDKRGNRSGVSPTAYAHVALNIVGYETTEQEDRKIAALLGTSFGEAEERLKVMRRVYESEKSEPVRRALCIAGASMQDKTFMSELIRELRQTKKWPINYDFIAIAGRVLSNRTGVREMLDPRSSDEDYESVLKQFEAWAKQ